MRMPGKGRSGSNQARSYSAKVVSISARNSGASSPRRQAGTRHRVLPVQRFRFPDPLPAVGVAEGLVLHQVTVVEAQGEAHLADPEGLGDAPQHGGEIGRQLRVQRQVGIGQAEMPRQGPQEGGVVPDRPRPQVAPQRHHQDAVRRQPLRRPAAIQVEGRRVFRAVVEHHRAQSGEAQQLFDHAGHVGRVVEGRDQHRQLPLGKPPAHVPLPSDRAQPAGASPSGRVKSAAREDRRKS